LYTEGLIKGPAELAHVRPASRSSRCNVIEALLAAGAPFDPLFNRHLYSYLKITLNHVHKTGNTKETG
jgi:hypothetical protein